MEEKLLAMSCQDFADALASKAPTPGGGAAAAYTAALGMGLLSMAANLTLGKKQYAPVQEEAQAILKRSEQLRAALQEGVERDAQVFAPLAQAYKLPEGTPEEAATKARVLADCSRLAAEQPLELARICREGLELARRLAVIGNMLLVSDVVCGADLLQAALRGLLVTVSINLSLVNDEEWLRRVQLEYSQLLVDSAELSAQVTALVDTRADKLAAADANIEAANREDGVKP